MERTEEGQGAGGDKRNQMNNKGLGFKIQQKEVQNARNMSLARTNSHQMDNKKHLG